ncbi:ABC-F family ATP-binding cassette domain-containing protein [Nonomuraea mesophila]|uniref:ABC-F family ATP-binding cassette domain-containing protein n=1 Tax=Nonomuraea mesophila TaxID=2530382 RepID=A0A4R5EU86_9ACTN|nr:ABC-F family ATP-binding cassette domain-containing protein [Nonomuraea mesophila]TDE38257.1 ABC-F family ATP-binding cassette domain-containing protein [Nonomuraea mesophila]
MSVGPGERAGVVGDNGSGKSTLLRLLAGVETPDDGEVTVPDDAGYLGQTLDQTFGRTQGLPQSRTVQQVIDAALAGLRAMERRMRELESSLTDDVMDEYGELLTAYEARGGWHADARVDRAFHGLGLAHVGRDRVLSSLSGGEQARLGLACVLAASPRVLLLDEPTNHLDASALAWLEDRLREHRGTVVAVSHDRIFLDRVATAVFEVERGAVTRFGGGYTGFLAAKAAARARWEQSYAAWREEVRQVREHAATTAHRVAAGRVMRDNNKMAYDRNAGRVQSSIASRVRNAHERLRRLEADPVPRPPDPLRFRGSFDGPPGATAGEHDGTAGEPRATTGEHEGAAGATAPSAPAGATAGERGDAPARVVVELRDVRVGDRLRVDALTIRAGDRLLVTGANGAGKSTLLRTIAEHAGCRAGCRAGSTVGCRAGCTVGCRAGCAVGCRAGCAVGCRVGFLPQEVAFDPDQTVLDAYGAGYPDERRDALLATGLFRPHTLDQKAGALSVGQQRRLALARLLGREHDLLLLDEPTNHLSPVLAEELEQALDSYDGTLVVVSHDRALTRRFRGNEIVLMGGTIC